MSSKIIGPLHMHKVSNVCPKQTKKRADLSRGNVPPTKWQQACTMKQWQEDKPTNDSPLHSISFLWLTQISDVCVVLQVHRCALLAHTTTSAGMLSKRAAE